MSGTDFATVKVRALAWDAKVGLVAKLTADPTAADLDTATALDAILDGDPLGRMIIDYLRSCANNAVLMGNVVS